MVYSRGQLILRLAGQPFSDGYWSPASGPDLGRGCFGAVTQAIETSTGKAVAVKQVPHQDARHVQAIQAEAHVHGLLDHPNIVKLYETYHAEKLTYFVLELCTGGSLLEHAKQRTFNEAEAATIMQQILRAAAYWQGLGLSHNDLCLRNIMFKEDLSKEPWLIKVIDFGCVEQCRQAQPRRGDLLNCGILIKNLICGYQQNEDASQSMTPSMLAETTTMSTGTSVPKPQRYLKPELWDEVSPECIHLHNILLVRDQQKRCTAQVALRHPWILHWCSSKRTPESGEVAQRLMSRMKSLKFASSLKRAAFMLIVDALDEAAVRPLRDAFLALDADCDGFVSLADLRHALQHADCADSSVIEESALLDALRELDVDDCGVVEYSAVLAALLEPAQIEAGSKRAFAFFKRGRRGRLNSAKLLELLNQKLPGQRLRAQELRLASKGGVLEGDLRCLNSTSFLAMLLDTSSRKSSLLEFFRCGVSRDPSDVGAPEERKSLEYRAFLKAAKTKIAAAALKEARDSESVSLCGGMSDLDDEVDSGGANAWISVEDSDSE
mmetsp:Transcript_1352/g.3633  ORF Transcript_1352/g.3633 Transcript_1352/m.3633 type:complete len:551 (+) Transcript_1352:63-1715(+)